MTSHALDANIAAMVRARRRDETQTARAVRFAERATRFIGSLRFLALQTAWIAGWVGVNAIKPFDPWPHPLLTLLLSIEAIYLTVLVLIAQNRMSDVAERRAEADLQINLLDEAESTRILRVVDAIALKVGAEVERDAKLEDLKQDVRPEDVLQRVEEEELALKDHHDSSGRRRHE